MWLSWARDTPAAKPPGPPRVSARTSVSEVNRQLRLELPEGVTFETLLTEHRVVLAPGEGFGPSGVGRARLSLAVDDETLELGLERLATAFSAAG